MSPPYYSILHSGNKVWPVRGASFDDCWVCEPVKTTKSHIVQSHRVRPVPECIKKITPSTSEMIVFDPPIVDKHILNSVDASYKTLYYLGFIVENKIW